MGLFRKKRADAPVNTEGWMMSYADMATILLAMFIVLTTLGKDQTGVSLQKGLESWRESRQFFGLSGMNSTSGQVTQLNNPGPHYSKDSGNQEGAEKPADSLDAETEELQRFLGELDRHFQVDKLPLVVGQATVDFFEPLNTSAPYLRPRHLEEMGHIVPVLRRSNYRVTLVVWATMPKESALLRAAEQAGKIADELAAAIPLDADMRSRLLSVGQPWRFPNYQRPFLSLVISKTTS